MILGSEERQPLMDEDIPLPFEPTSGSAEIGAASGVVASGGQ